MKVYLAGQLGSGKPRGIWREQTLRKVGVRHRLVSYADERKAGEMRKCLESWRIPLVKDPVRGVEEK